MSILRNFSICTIGLLKKASLAIVVIEGVVVEDYVVGRVAHRHRLGVLLGGTHVVHTPHRRLLQAHSVVLRQLLLQHLRQRRRLGGLLQQLVVLVPSLAAAALPRLQVRRLLREVLFLEVGDVVTVVVRTLLFLQKILELLLLDQFLWLTYLRLGWWRLNLLRQTRNNLRLSRVKHVASIIVAVLAGDHPFDFVDPCHFIVVEGDLFIPALFFPRSRYLEFVECQHVIIGIR